MIIIRPIMRNMISINSLMSVVIIIIIIIMIILLIIIIIAAEELRRPGPGAALRQR